MRQAGPWRRVFPLRAPFATGTGPRRPEHTDYCGGPQGYYPAPSRLRLACPRIHRRGCPQPRGIVDALTAGYCEGVA